MFGFVEEKAEAWKHSHAYLKFLKVDTVRSKNTAKNYTVETVPTFVFVRFTREAHRFSGNDYETQLENYIAKKYDTNIQFVSSYF